MKNLLKLVLLALLTCGVAGLGLQAQDQGVGQDVKNAGQSTKNAARKNGKKIKRTTKKVGGSINTHLNPLLLVTSKRKSLKRNILSRCRQCSNKSLY